MCGFVAILNHAPNVDIAAARAALDTISHRGPDAAGEWSERNVVLLHRRLSIIDISTGQQPMQSSDGRYVIVFNGEIYNFQELRHTLIEKGCRFQTRSDTEVILEGYRCWGERVVERLNGMFAFVIWDRVQAVAFGARDRLGIKPLCWAMQRDTLVISSTLEPFGALEGFDYIDPVAVRDLMTFDYIPCPQTILQGVKKLEPGSRFSWRFGADEPRIECYWSPPPVDTKMEVPSQEELEILLDRAVMRQMISDVPIGVFLSGGIDSSLIVALMARHSEKPIRTFSIAFDNPCQFNLHKTFGAPISLYGPAFGALGVTAELAPFLPVPIIVRDGDSYRRDYDRPQSVGRTAGFLGNVPSLVKGYAWIRAIGPERIADVARYAVLNNNYVHNRLGGVDGITTAVPVTTTGGSTSSGTASSSLKEETGIGTEEVRNRIIDYGLPGTG